MRPIHTLLFLIIISFANAQNVKIIHSDFKSAVPGVKNGILKNTYNYMVRSDEPVSIDSIDINNDRIWFPDSSISLKDSINIRIRLLINNYYSDKEKKIVKVMVNGKEISAKLQTKPVRKNKITATSFLMSAGKRRFCLDITKFDTEIFVPMP